MFLKPIAEIGALVATTGFIAHHVLLIMDVRLQKIVKCLNSERNADQYKGESYPTKLHFAHYSVS